MIYALKEIGKLIEGKKRERKERRVARSIRRRHVVLSPLSDSRSIKRAALRRAPRTR